MNSLPALGSACKLSDVHLRNATVLPDRRRLYEALPKGAVVAELGVAGGDNAAVILEVARPRELHLFDLWPGDTNARYRHVRDRFAAAIEAGTAHMHRGDDLVTLSRFPNAYFDWVYLDSSHEYLHTKKELRLLRRKVREGGIICGHDYVNLDPYMHADYAWYWLKHCVNEFCVRYGWEIIHLTMECSSNPSFAVREVGAATDG